MGKAIPIVMGNNTFPSKTRALDYLRKMLNSYDYNQTVSKAHEEELKSIIDRHPLKDEKLSGGFSHFRVVKAEFNKKCFHIVRPDGSSIDVSAQWCINRKG